MRSPQKYYKVKNTFLGMTDDLPEIRKSHPYVMYDMMKDIPNGIRATLNKMREADYSFLDGPLYLTGNGTAYHSAAIGGQVLTGSGKPWHLIQSYELEKYHRPEGVVVGVSHTGKTKSTVDSLIHSGKFAKTVAITHYPDSPLTEAADYSIIIGNSPDMSLCNTKAFFDNAAAVFEISKRYGNLDLDFNPVSEAIVKAVETMDGEIRSISKELNDIRDVFVLGAGPNYITAREAAQKIKESTHIHAEGIELEEFNHGCTAVIDDNTLIVIISTPNVMERTTQIVNASKKVGSRTLVLNGEGDFTVDTGAPDNEYLTPFVNMVPLYYLAYYMSVNRDLNPDFLRFEDKRYLDYDSIVFPPGAH
jgi:glucosamine--fructose-6-phosphate aminotransferase (isomerizing)